MGDLPGLMDGGNAEEKPNKAWEINETKFGCLQYANICLLGVWGTSSKGLRSPQFCP